MNGDLYWLLYFAFFAVGGVFLFVFVRRQLPNVQVKRANFDPAWGGRLLSGRVEEGAVQGISYRFEYFSGDKRRDAYFRIFIDTARPFDFDLVRENIFDRLFKWLKVSREAVSGDPEFDKTYYILGDWPKTAARIFNSAESRDAASRIFRLGFRKLRLSHGALEARQEGLIDLTVISPSAVEAAAVELGRIVKELPPEGIDGENPGNAKGRLLKRLSVFVLPFILCYGVPASVWGCIRFQGLDTYSLFLQSLPWSLGAAGVYLGAAFWLIRGTSSAHRDLCVLLIMSLMGFLTSGFAILLFTVGLK